MKAADQTLLVGRVRQVQRYLLTSPRLRQIRGGSRLLVEIEHELRSELESERFNGKVGCAAGGILLAAFDGQQPAQAQAALEQARRTFAVRAPAAQFHAKLSPWNEGDDFQSALRSALSEGARADPGDNPTGFGPPPDLPFVMSCDICRARPARAEVRQAGQAQRACDDCIARHRTDKKLLDPASGWGQLMTRLQSAGVLVKEPEGHAPTILDLAKGRPRNYLGYVAADGNAIGERLGELDSLGQYEQFSTRLNQATRNALGHAAEVCATTVPGATLLPVLAGGDDLLLFTSPALAVPLAVEFAKAFERTTEQAMGRRLCTGVGVVIAHASTPFGALDEAAHDLQKRAKALARTNGGGSAIGFHVLRTGGRAGPERLHTGWYAGVGRYLLADCEKLVNLATQLSDCDPPWSRLAQVDALLRRMDPAVEDDFTNLMAARSMSAVERLIGEALELPSGSDETPQRLWRAFDGDYVSALPDLLALAEVL